MYPQKYQLSPPHEYWASFSKRAYLNCPRNGIGAYSKPLKCVSALTPAIYENSCTTTSFLIEPRKSLESTKVTKLTRCVEITELTEFIELESIELEHVEFDAESETAGTKLT